MSIDEMVEVFAAEVHNAWMRTKRAQGFKTRRSESGEELMVHYPELSEAAKELDRMTVRAVLAAIADTPTAAVVTSTDVARLIRQAGQFGGTGVRSAVERWANDCGIGETR